MLSDKEMNVLQLIEEDVSYENYFFKRAKGLKWFIPLKEKGYFSPLKAPIPQPADGDNYYIPYWNVLGYLERSSQELSEIENKEYVKEFLYIIECVTNYANNNPHLVDNYQIWDSFVKIILNIPNMMIPLKIIELIPIWLQSKFGRGLQGTNIAIKLLPKFLLENATEDDIEKAEKIINYITEVKPVLLDKEKIRIYRKEKEYSLVIDDYWLRQSSKKYADVIGRKCSRKVVDDLLEKIKLLLKKEKSRALIEKEDKKSYAIILKEEDNNYVVKIALVEEESYQYLFDEEKEGSIIQTESLPISKEDDFVENAYNKIKRLEYFKEILETQLKQKLHYLYNNLYDDETYNSLYATYDYPRTKPIEVLINFLKEILISKTKFKPIETEEITKDLFKENYLFFHKLGLFIIAQEPAKYGHIFWSQLENKNYKLIKEDLYYGDEIRNLLKRISNFQKEQKDLLNTIIEMGPEYLEYEEDREKRLAVWKQQRYEALIHDKDFKAIYEHYKSLSGVDTYLHPAVGPVVVRTGSGQSHLTKEQMLQKTNEELSAFLLQAKDEGFWEGYTIRALGDVLKGTVKDKPEKFTNDMSPFLRNGYLWIYEILWGLRDAWKNKQPIDWDNVLSFINIYILQDDFWNDKYKIDNDDFYKPNHKWVVGEIAGLIEDGTKTDDWAFDISLLKKAEEIIFNILDNLKNDNKGTSGKEEEEEYLRDPISYALNSTFGKILDAFINFALRKARVEKKEFGNNHIHWSDALKGKYEKVLANKIPEAYTLLGQYMPNFLYLDNNWVKKKIKEFEDLNEDKLWHSFFYGYLFTNNFYDELYLLMKKYYEKALISEIKGDRANERLVQHISLAYIRGFEDLSETSFFGLLLKKEDISQIEDIIEFFWMIQGQLDKASSEEYMRGKQKIIQFWKFVYEKYKIKKELNDENKKILSTLSRLIVFLDEINLENFEWLKLSAIYLNIDFNSPHFIEHLDILKNKGNSAHYVGKIYLEMLNNFTPDFDEKHITSTIEYLFNKNDEEINNAKKICETYGRRGFDFLRPIFEKYRDK